MAQEKSMTSENASDHEFVLTRVFDAPRALVWKPSPIPNT